MANLVSAITHELDCVIERILKSKDTINALIFKNEDLIIKERGKIVGYIELSDVDLLCFKNCKEPELNQFVEKITAKKSMSEDYLKENEVKYEQKKPGMFLWIRVLCPWVVGEEKKRVTIDKFVRIPLHYFSDSTKYIVSEKPLDSKEARRDFSDHVQKYFMENYKMPLDENTKERIEEWIKEGKPQFEDRVKIVGKSKIAIVYCVLFG